MRAYKVWSEWDIGEDNVVFSSYDAARDWLEENTSIKDMNDGTVFELMSAGLLGIQEVEFR